MTTSPNPNWPTLFAEGEFGANPFFGSPGTLPVTELSKRLYKSWTTQRGKQFELDSVQAGEFQGGWINTDGALDPVNTASALYPNVLPFRGYRVRVQYPPSVNLLTADQATGGEGTPLTAGTTGTAYGVTGAYGNLVVTASGTAYQGTQVWQFTGTTASAGSAIITCQAAGVGQTDGLAYTMSIQARSVTTSANPHVQPFVQWLDASGTVLSTTTGGAVTLTGSPTATWTSLTLTATMPTSGHAVAAQFGLTLTVAPAGTWSFQADGLQWEQASSASAFAVPGKTYYMISGNVERYPQSWDYTGTYGIVSPICVDPMAILSQGNLLAPFAMDVLTLGPNFFYQLNDPATATACTDSSGNRIAVPVDNSPFGAGSLTLGSAITSTTPGSGFVGSPGPVATFANNPTAPPAQSAETYLSLHKTTTNPGPPGSAWTRIVAFRSATAPTGANSYMIWGAQDSNAAGKNPRTLVTIVSGSGGQFTTQYEDGTGTTFGGTVTTNACDGNWHLSITAVTPGGSGSFQSWYDGVLSDNSTGVSIGAASGITTDTVGASVDSVGFTFNQGMVGDIAHVIEFPFAVNSTQAQNLYTSWRNAWSGESSGARYGRVLTWAGFTGSRSIDTGSTTSLGAASDVTGQDALTALQNIVNTENGQHFIGVDGTAVFQGRTKRYNASPVYIFGDANPLGAEIPYESLTFDFDVTHLSNIVQVTQVSTGQVFATGDSTSQDAYGQRTLTRDNQTTSPNECQDEAAYLLSRYKDPHLRVATMRLHPSANPSVLFPVCLSLELGMRVRVMRRPPAPAATIQMDGFIEAIVHNPDDGGEWFTDVQISNADTSQYWQLAALRTTLHAQATSGTNTASINALPDAAVNKLAQSIPAGYQLTFEPGTVRAETLTLASGGIPSTTLGYTSATLTFTTNFAFTHAANSVVCEPLPTGITDATTWDTYSVLGASYTTLAVSSSIGDFNVLTGALSDSKVNPMSSDFIPGDTLWLSAGTANFETATVSAVVNTFPGYTNATIDFVSSLTKGHTFGDFISEPLPAGVTDPTALPTTPTARLAY